MKVFTLPTRCNRCTEPIEPTQSHVVVTRTVEQRHGDEIHVEHAEAIAEYHAGCAPSADDLGELVHRG